MEGGGGEGGRLTWLHAPRMMADTSEIVLVVCSTDQVSLSGKDTAVMTCVPGQHDVKAASAIQHQMNKNSSMMPCMSCQHQVKSDSAMTMTNAHQVSIM